MPLQLHTRVQKSCCYPVTAVILVTVMYVDKNRIRHNCEELVQEFEKSVKHDCRINLQREGKLDWCVLVRYNYKRLIGTFGCSEEAYINCLGVKYGMENVHACKLPMNADSNPDSLPVLDTPYKIVVHAYAALMGELLYIVINTMPQLSYFICCLPRYMSKATLAHLACTKVVLRYLFSVKGRQLTQRGQLVSLPHVSVEILAFIKS